jgi:hypothetical protein
MAKTFAEKFEQALADKREQEPGYGLRTLARALAKDDAQQAEIIRRRLHKYRPPKNGGGAAEVKPTISTRREIEKALGVEIDSLAPDPDAVAARSDADFLETLHTQLGLALGRAKAPA